MERNVNERDNDENEMMNVENRRKSDIKKQAIAKWPHKLK
jgi:hypothetical protein